MTDQTSKNIHEAFRFVGKAGKEISALKVAIDDAIVRISRANPQLVVAPDDEEESPTYRWRWVCNGYATTYKVTASGKRSGRAGSLYYLFDLAMENGPAQQLSQAVICVGYVSKGTNLLISSFEPWMPLTEINGHRWELAKDKRIWFWNALGRDPSDLTNSCWVYFVPLGQIHTPADVESILVLPPFDLLKGRSLPKLAKILQFDKGEFALDKKIG